VVVLDVMCDDMEDVIDAAAGGIAATTLVIASIAFSKRAKSPLV
jgi:hypothetical protein